jgi:para-aminobenzoate synthetase component I
MTDAGPVVLELVPAPDPARACERLEGLPYRLFLDSATRLSPLSRYSFLTADPWAVVRTRDARTEVLEPGEPPREVEEDALEMIRQRLAPFAARPIEGLPPFQGGAAGYIGYEWGQRAEHIPHARYDDLALPDLVFGLYDCVVAWDLSAQRTWIISTGMPEQDAGARQIRARERALRMRDRLNSSVTQIGATVATTPMSVQARGAPPAHAVGIDDWSAALGLQSSFTQHDYIAAVQRVREYIYAGDVFQVNLSQRFGAPLQESAWSFYRRLRIRNAAPFAAFLDFTNPAILIATPERFLRLAPDGHVETRPIKGTRPRGVGPEHDAHLGQALSESEKDRAENLMIVDLMRNDLSRVCRPGTVAVPELFALEQYATVHHLVSTVVGELMPGEDAVSLLRATLPGGSITGAPKVRAMEIIAELEPVGRGPYCGNIGYWSVSGALDTNIAIRTAVARSGRVSFSAGGGIVADSDPTQEYRETLDKARGMIDSLAAPNGTAAR